jgi:hypothetical protein
MANEARARGVTDKHRSAAAWAIAIVLGAIHTAAYRFYVNPDGLSYIDLASLYARGDWQAAVNGYWSPVYPFVIGMVFRVMEPSSYWEAPLVHAVGFGAYIVAFVSFRLLLRVIRERQDSSRGAGADASVIDFRRSRETYAAYALFHLSAITWIGLENLTPDMFVAAVGYAAAAVALRAGGSGRLVLFALAGALAGVGYLTKAIMFPVGFVFCIACAIPSRGLRQYVTGTALALSAFLIVCAPQVVMLSRQGGAPTYGAVGNLAYSWLVNKTPLRWTGRPVGTGTPEHPIRRIDSSLPAFEFSYPQPAFAYPFWDIPAYWREGIKSRFDAGQQLEASAKVLLVYAKVFGFLAVAILLLIVLRSPGISPAFLPMVIPGLAALGLYALVHAEPRLVGPWPILVFLGTAASLRFAPGSHLHARRTLIATAAIAVVVICVDTARPAVKLVRELSGEHERNLQVEVAEALRANGVKAGNKVAAIEAAWEGHWAHLAGVQIAMEVVKRAPWRATTDSARLAVMRKFRQEGAVAIVELRDSAEIPLPGWQSVGSSRYSFLILGDQLLPLRRGEAIRAAGN